MASLSSPSKHHSIKFLDFLEAENFTAKNGEEFAESEVRDMLNRKRQAKADREVDKITRSRPKPKPRAEVRKVAPPSPNQTMLFWSALDRELNRDQSQRNLKCF